MGRPPKKTGSLKVYFVVVATSLLLSFLSIYIPQIHMKLSFRALPIFLGGWCFGPSLGLLNSFIAEIGNYPWTYSGCQYIFMLQGPIIALWGAYGRKFDDFCKKNPPWVPTALMVLVMGIIFALMGYPNYTFIMDPSIHEKAWERIMSVVLFIICVLTFFSFSEKTTHTNKNVFTFLMISSFFASMVVGTFATHMTDTNVSSTFTDISYSTNTNVLFVNRGYKELFKNVLIVFPALWFIADTKNVLEGKQDNESK